MRVCRKAVLCLASLWIIPGAVMGGEPENREVEQPAIEAASTVTSESPAPEAEPQRIVVTATRISRRDSETIIPDSLLASSSPYIMDVPQSPAPQTQASPVITATRVPTPVENVISPVSVFTGSQPGQSDGSSASGGEGSGVSLGGALTAGNIEARQYRNVQDLLQTVPGLFISSNGGQGSFSTVYMRGLKAGNTKVFVDGMPMNDPSTPDGSFDFGTSPLDNVGQFEVLRGQHSTLYGSAATGGVVNLTSQKGEGPFKGFVSAEAGSRGTVRTRLGASAGNEKGDFSFAGSIFHTDGISSADKRLGNTEKDKYEYGSFNVRLGANVGDTLRFDLFANGFKGEREEDDEGVDDLYRKGKVERFMIRPQATLSLFDDRWEQTVGFGYAKTTKKSINDNPAYNPDWDGWTRSKYEGETLRFDYKSILRLHETNTLLVGVDVERESMKSVAPAYGSGYHERLNPDNVTTTGVYIEDQMSFCDRLFINVGGRYTHHETFGDKFTWNANAMYVFPTNTRIKASAGTGFKAPTLFQLYAPIYGSDDLKAERSFGWDAGVEQSFLENRLVLGSTFFQNRVRDGIDSHPITWKNFNIGKYWAYGIESFVTFAVTDRLSISANHTWLRTKSFDTDHSELIRRPRNQINVNVDWKFHEKGTLTAGVRYVGKQWDNSFDPASFISTRVRMPSYAVARVAASWKVNKRVEVFGRVENMLNKKYQPVCKYGAEPISFYGGATISF